MIYQTVALHNVAHIEELAGGVQPWRVPPGVREQLEEAAQHRVREPENCEIRFVCDREPVEITLSSEGETDVMVFHGPFDPRCVRRITTERRTLTIPPPPMVHKLERRFWQAQGFDPAVYRVVFGGMRRDPVVIHEIKGRHIRPPTPEQLPGTRYLAYGTSITQGHMTDAVHLNYVSQAAWHLGADLINLGVCGACQCEPAFADYIAGRDDWNVASLELSVNMNTLPMPTFKQRVEYLVNTIAGSAPRRPVVCITVFPYWPDMGPFLPTDEFGGMPDDYRQCLRDIVRESAHPNLFLVEGPDILTNCCGLTVDLVHPATNGMIEMGHNLAEHLRRAMDQVV
jgi:hypothetical protein